MRRHRVALVLVLALAAAPSLAAQLRPASRWALGLGWTHMAATGSLSSSASGFGIVGSFAPMLTSTLGLEIEGRAIAGGGSEIQPTCAPVPDTPCEGRTLIPSEVIGLDGRLSFVPDPQLRLSAGPAVAWAPNAIGPNSDPAFGLSLGLGLSPFDRRGRGASLELRGTRFFSTLGEVDWVLGTGFSWRF
jgi:hypothetical protein